MKQKPDYSAEHLAQSFPGRVTNEKLLKSFDKYLRDDNQDDPTNFAIKNKLRERYEYHLIPKSVWEMFKNKYGGFEIKRQKDDPEAARKFEVKFPKV